MTVGRERTDDTPAQHVSPTLERLNSARQRLAESRRLRTGRNSEPVVREDRPAEEPPTMAAERAAKFVANFSTSGVGLEIGPSHNPIAPKSAGFDVRILDHKTQEGLRTKYEDHNVDIDAIEPVDFLWQGERYIDLVGDQRFDWIIASHVIEHVPDLVGFINDCLEILKPGGTLALVVPDMRCCFDALRPPSSLSELVDSHHAARVAPSPGQVADFYLNLASRDDKTSWHPAEAGPWGSAVTITDALRFTNQAFKGRKHDVHVWRFTPTSLRLQLAQLGLLKMVETDAAFHQESAIGEFYIGLTHKAETSTAPTEQDLLALALQARHELAGFSPKNTD